MGDDLQKEFEHGYHVVIFLHTGILTEFGDALDNNIVTSRDAAGSILVNGGAVTTWEVRRPSPTPP